MKQLTSFSLIDHNTFAIDSICPEFYQPESVGDLKSIPKNVIENSYILGEGSNTLFISNASPVIIKPLLKGIGVEESSDHFIVKVAAGENWHELVVFCINNNINGLENLALIPGSVGASPVQNIGAYGVELADYCQSVEWFEFETQQVNVLLNEECHFSYRDSIFKNALKNKGVITSVTLKFPKKWQANIGYAGLDQLVELGDKLTATDIMNKVIEIRQHKLPEPDLLPNAGSFFKNPVINVDEFEKLLREHPKMPHYAQPDGKIKLAAGWLIEATGLKGYKINGVGVHEKQALVLVNFGGAKGQEIVELAKYVQNQVQKRFAVKLTPEVRFINAIGECNTEQLQQL